MTHVIIGNNRQHTMTITVTTDVYLLRDHHKIHAKCGFLLPDTPAQRSETGFRNKTVVSNEGGHSQRHYITVIVLQSKSFSCNLFALLLDTEASCAAVKFIRPLGTFHPRTWPGGLVCPIQEVSLWSAADLLACWVVHLVNTEWRTLGPLGTPSTVNMHSSHS